MTKTNIKQLIPFFIAIPVCIVVIVMNLLHYRGGVAIGAEAQPAPEATEEALEQPETVTDMSVTELAEEFGNVGFEDVSESEVSEDVGALTAGFDGSNVMAAPSWHFYNSDLQDNGDKKDDYNFGPNPLISDAFSAKVMEAIKAKNYQGTINIDELFKDVDASGLDQEFRERLRVDPALGAADMAWFDSIVGTRYLGEFYSEAKSQWDAAMNNAKDRWRADGDEYSKTLDAFEKYLNSATKVEIRRASGLTDQMYMNPFTVEEGVPDIVVMESADHSGWFLVYTFTIKETAVKEVMYRLDCGFQPTNVAKVMNVTPKKNPNKTSSGGGTISGGGGGGSISGGGTKTTTINGGGVIPGPVVTPTPVPPTPTPPGPTPTPKPTDPPKDPTKGTPVLPNDDTGPGENTNTGKGGQYSSKDQVGNSNDMTRDEYKETIGEMEDNPGREAGDSTPSTPPPSSDTHEDNNGKEADKPTEKSESSVSDDPAGEAFDGPPD